MGVSIRRFPDLGVSLLTLHGLVASEELSDFARRIDQGVPRRWITYIEPGADLTQLDLLFFTELKRLIGAKLKAQFGDEEFRSALVCDSRVNDAVIRLWASYVGRDETHPSKPAVFSALGQAFDYLELATPARAAISEALGLKPAAGAEKGAARR
jgi:hypothetical protein